MWLLHFLPIGFMLIIVHGILAVGLIGMLLSFASKFIPGIGTYSTPIRIISTIIIVLGIYLEGVVGTHQWYQDKVKDLEAKVAISEAQSKELNAQLSSVLQKEDTIIENHTETIRTEIREKLVPLDKDCKLDPLVVDILNRSASNPLATAPTGEETK